MNEMISEALNLAYKYVSSLDVMQNIEIIENCLKNIAGVSDFVFSIQYSLYTPYKEIQDLLSKLNEKESIRKSKGVYYTPSDVVQFIVANTIKSSLGCLEPENIKDINLDYPGLEEFCIQKTIFEPTCGAGEFLLETLERKFDFWSQHHTEIDSDTICKIVGTIYGNDINNDSIVISKLRLFICAVSRFGIKKCSELASVLNANFTTNDYVVAPPDNGERYDVILGNPPYVEDHKSGLPLIVKYGNIYANVLENAAKHLADGGSMGFIIPLSYSSTPRMRKIRDVLFEVTPEQYVLCYADRPDCLFDSVHQKLCILIGKNTGKKPRIYTGNYQYWYQEERASLFSNTSVVENTFMNRDCIPKLGTNEDISIFNKIVNKQYPSVYSVSRNGEESVYVNRREAFWIKAFRDPHIHPEFKVFSYPTKGEADFCYCLVNSSLFWWYWISTSDCWHVSKELNGFCAPAISDCDEAVRLAKALANKLEETKVYVGTKQTDYEYKHKSCVSEIRAIDDYINALFGLTDHESEYIKNFAFKYRVSGGA